MVKWRSYAGCNDSVFPFCLGAPHALLLAEQLWVHMGLVAFDMKCQHHRVIAM